MGVNEIHKISLFECIGRDVTLSEIKVVQQIFNLKVGKLFYIQIYSGLLDKPNLKPETDA
ncbi:hypothetical protein DMZ48_04460 [Robertkochia solimangrovi]|nr:hypothetical protein DMZ48_04460 [Robertkochia solimangrovi]